MAERDIRWEQRFNNYKKAFSQLKKFIDKGELSELEMQGLVRVFLMYLWISLDNNERFFGISWSIRYLWIERCDT